MTEFQLKSPNILKIAIVIAIGSVAMVLFFFAIIVPRGMSKPFKGGAELASTLNTAEVQNLSQLTEAQLNQRLAVQLQKIDAGQEPVERSYERQAAALMQLEKSMSNLSNKNSAQTRAELIMSAKGVNNTLAQTGTILSEILKEAESANAVARELVRRTGTRKAELKNTDEFLSKLHEDIADINTRQNVAASSLRKMISADSEIQQSAFGSRSESEIFSIEQQLIQSGRYANSAKVELARLPPEATETRRLLEQELLTHQSTVEWAKSQLKSR